MLLRFLSVLFFTSLVSVGMTAQARAQLPSSADAARAQKQITQQRPMPETPLALPEQKSEAPVVAPDGAADISFELSGLIIDGMNAYTLQDVAPLFEDKIGKTITLADVFGLAAQLTTKYRNDGYILSRVVVPPQTVDGGKIRLQAVEGFVDKISFQGAVPEKIEFLANYARHIQIERPLRARTLERYTLLMSDLAGLEARAVLSPSPTTPGASDLVFILERKSIEGFAQLDNRGSRYIGAWQVNTGVQVNNPFGAYEAITVQIASAPDGWPDREMDNLGLTWAQPVGSNGTIASASFGVTSTLPGFDIENLGIHGVARTLALRVDHPFIRSRTENLTCSVTFDALNSKRKDAFGAANVDDRLRVLRAALNWEAARMGDFPAFYTLNIEASQGLDVLGASKKGAAGLTRALGDPDFTKATFTATRTQPLTQTLEVYTAVTGQLSNHTLLASEEFGVGGASFGSAYDGSEITGEDGFAARVELRLNNPIDPITLPVLQLYSFYDVGKVWDKDNAVPKDRKRSLASAGIGARFAANDTFSGSFELAAPLTRVPGTQKDTDPRFFTTLSVRF